MKKVEEDFIVKDNSIKENVQIKIDCYYEDFLFIQYDRNFWIEVIQLNQEIDYC